MIKDDLTAKVKRLALEAGFDRVAIATAGPVPAEHAGRFRDWLAAGRHADMDYMADNLSCRFDPCRLVQGARSVICLAVSYAPSAQPGEAGRRGTVAQVARYARGRDYHKVLKKRAAILMDRLRTIEQGFMGRAFVDSAPVMERSLAALAGLGWIGRNGCLIVPGLGSYVVLGEIVCNLPLTPGEPMSKLCGDCDACVRACPTGACLGDGTIDARICNSYLTVEHRRPIDRALWQGLGVRLFGCDACQEACPHNRCLPAGSGQLLGPPGLGLAEVLAWTENDWDEATRGRAIRRASLAMLLRNAVIAAGNSGDKSLAPALKELRRSRPELAELADWALQRLGGPREI